MSARLPSLTLCLLLVGCGSDPKDLGFGAADALNKGIAKEQSAEVAMLTEFQDDDAKLRFLSAGGYSCGDPRDKRVHDALAKRNLAESVAERYRLDAIWSKNLAVITDYATFVQSVLDANKAAHATVQSATTAAKGGAQLGGFLPPLAAIATLADPAGAVLGTGLDAASVAKLQAKARAMAKPLETAVSNLEAEYPIVTAGGRTAFALWNACAREKLIFIRDVPFGRVPHYDARIGPSSGVELDQAYQAYLDKRRLYAASSEVLKLLKDINTANTDLISKTTAASAEKLVEAASQVDALVKAADALRKS